MVRFNLSDSSGIEVSKDLFGGNILFDRDRLGDTGTFDDTVAKAGISSVRYPGGAISEWYFDITNPNKTQAVDRAGVLIDLMPLSEFMTWAGGANVGVNIVIPSRDLLVGTGVGRGVRSDAFDDVKGFVKDVLEGKYGSAKVLAFEIGNEYFYSGEMNIEEYTQVADVVAKAAQEAMDDLKIANNSQPDIAVQVGQFGAYSQAPGWLQNDYIIEHLTDEAADAIDAVVAHYYAKGSFNDLPYYDYYFDRLDVWAKSDRFDDVEFHVTEWNLDNWHTEQTGLKQASAMLWMFAQMVSRGVDAAFIWPVQQNTAIDLSHDEGSSELTFAGQTFRMMSETLPDSELVGREAFDGGFAYLFKHESRTIIFVASHSNQQVEATLDLTLVDPYGKYAAQYLGTNGHVADPNAGATVRATSGQFDQSISVVLDPYEIARFVLNQQRITTVPDRNDLVLAGTSGEDSLTGGAGNDNLFGFGGRDRIAGGSGADTIDGGNGRDHLKGEDGVDKIYGGKGSDYIHGGFGNDELWGGDGHDLIQGGHGDDYIVGNDGNDRLQGNAGDDIIYGGAGHDRMAGGSGRDVLEGEDGNDLLVGQAGNDRLIGGNGADHMLGGDGDDLLVGGSGRDVLHGGPGNDRLLGLGGDDIFRFLPGDGNDRIIQFLDGDLIDLSAMNVEYADLNIQRGRWTTRIEVDDISIVVTQLQSAIGVDDFIL